MSLIKKYWREIVFAALICGMWAHLHFKIELVNERVVYAASYACIASVAAQEGDELDVDTHCRYLWQGPSYSPGLKDLGIYDSYRKNN